jgi:hypothetical protein
MSVKSVPGCLVSIEPRLIGVPVAACPGFGPHDEVPDEALLEEPEVLELEAALGAAPELLLELLLLPHPTNSATATNVISATTTRRRTGSSSGRRASLSRVTISYSPLV